MVGRWESEVFSKINAGLVWVKVKERESERERDSLGQPRLATLVYFSTLNLLLSMVKCTNQLENSCF